VSTTAHRRVITLHRWLGLLIAVQLIVSAAGGLYWATRDHKETKGLTRRRAVAKAPIAIDGLVPLATLVSSSAGGPAAGIEKARLYRVGERVVWEFQRAGGGALERVDAATGKPAAEVTEAEAIAIVTAEYDGAGTVARATRITENPHDEWAGRPLPVWRVEVADAYGTRAYVDPWTGETGSAWFTDGEAWWGWLFQLHTMDWDGGPLAVNPILAAFAVGVIATAVSGLTLWAFRLAARRRSRTIAAERSS
jgi:hypothetical protein